MLLVVPLSKLVSMVLPTKIGLFGSEVKPMPAAGVPLTSSDESILPSPLMSKKSADGLVPVNGSRAMIQPWPDGLQGSLALGIREVPSSKLPWN